MNPDLTPLINVKIFIGNITDLISYSQTPLHVQGFRAIICLSKYLDVYLTIIHHQQTLNIHEILQTTTNDIT